MANDDIGERAVAIDSGKAQVEAPEAQQIGAGGPVKPVGDREPAANRANERADSFERLPPGEALAKHPELDGAYAQLREVREVLANRPLAEREDAYTKARNEIASDLRRGEIPEGAVTRAESARVIDLTASEQGIKSVRDSSEVQRDVKGEVVAVSSQHALVAVSQDVAVRFEKDALDRAPAVGEKVAIQHGADKAQVHEQGKEPQKEQQDMARELAR